MAIPILETDRLRLRGPELSDFPAVAALWGDPLVTRYLGGVPIGQEAAWWRLMRYLGHWQLLSFGYWVVEEKATGAFVGEVGFADLKREGLPSISGLPEIGWILASSAHGKGFATEAAQRVIAWGEQRFQRGRTVCLIDPANQASLRVAAKCGYREFELASYKGQPVQLLARES